MNKWLEHVKKVQRQYPNLPLRVILKIAKKSYRKHGRTPWTEPLSIKEKRIMKKDNKKNKNIDSYQDDEDDY